MPKKVHTPRGRALTARDEDQFVYWLERCATGKEAAVMAGVALSTMNKRRQRSSRFRDRWEATTNGKRDARVELFWAYLKESGVPGPAFRKAGLTGGWFAWHMAKDPGFHERVLELSGGMKQDLAVAAINAALKEGNEGMLLKMVEKWLADVLPRG